MKYIPTKERKTDATELVAEAWSDLELSTAAAKKTAIEKLETALGLLKVGGFVTKAVAAEMAKGDAHV